MSEETNYDINVEVNGTGSLRAAANALASINGNLRDVATSLNSAVKQLDRLEAGFAGVSRGSKAIDGATKANERFKVSVNEVARAQAIAAKSYGPAGASYGSSVKLDSTTDPFANVNRRNDLGQFRSLADMQDELARSTDNATRAMLHNEKQTYLAQRGAVLAAFAGEKYANVTDDAAKKTSRFSQALAVATGHTSSLGETGTRTRYALFDMGYGLTIAGTALAGFSVAAAAASISFESDFANVIRTANDGSISMGKLREELIELSREIPVTFGEISKIATLGGQLGISAGGLDDFTSVVARLTATTDLTAEAAGTALGRFQALLGVPSDEFENLASAILKVGVNSVATETQIVAISTQISSMADFAGFTADQVIGLAGALGSVGAAPELSRGTITRVFSNIANAVSGSTERLDEFARVAGVSAETVSQSFGTDQFAGVFQKFLSGLGKMEEDGENVIQVLNGLGIESVRDVPLLLRLAGATEVVSQAFADAASGYALGTELQEQYGIIATTTAARIQILINSLQALFARLGAATHGPLAEFISGLGDAVQGFEKLISTDVGQRIAVIATVLTGLVGVLALLGGALALVVGSAFAARLALRDLGLMATTAAPQLDAAAAAANRTAFATGLLSKVLKGLLLATVALTLPDFFKEMTDEVLKLNGVSQSVTSSVGRIKDIFADLSASGQDIDTFGENTNEVIAGIRRLTGALGADVGPDGFYRDIANIDEGLASLAATNPASAARQLEELRKQFLANGFSQGVFNTLFRDTLGALGDVSAETKTASESQLAMAEAQQVATEQNVKLANALGITEEAATSLTEAIAEGTAGFFNFGQMIADAYEEGGGGLDAFMAKFDEQLVAAQTFNDSLLGLVKAGAIGAAQAFAEAGPGAAQAASDALSLAATDPARLAELEAKFAAAGTLSSSEYVAALLAGVAAGKDPFATETTKVVEDGSAAGNQAMTDKPILLQIQDQAAKDKFAAFKQTIEGQAIYANIVPVINGGSDYFRLTPAGAVATGGLIRGPGTGTSDTAGLFALSDEEYVIKAKSAKSMGTPMLNYMNKYGRIPGFATGGSVGGQSQANLPTSSDIGKIINVSVVQYYPTTRDPIKVMKRETEAVAGGIWE